MEQISGDRFPPLSSKYPWLIAQSIEDENHNTQDQFFCTLDNELPHYRCRIPELLGKRIRGYFHGWVILSNHPYNNIWSLWNQVTSKIISLPTLVLEDGEYESIHQYCLSAPPDDPSSILLLTTTNKSIFLFCPIDSKREDFRWTEMSYAQQLKRLTSNGKLLHSLTCCSGKVYALSTDSNFGNFVIYFDIVVKYNEVVINLMLFSVCPLAPYGWGGEIQCLKGSPTELFFIEIAFDEATEQTEYTTENKPTKVYLFKSDMTCINWEERRECFKDWDLTDVKTNVEDSSSEDSSSEEVNIIYDPAETIELWTEYYEPEMDRSSKVWKVIDDLKDAIFFIDVARDYSVFYNPVVASELGGYIHIHGEMGKAIYSYNVKDNTISLSYVPSPMLPTSHVSMWESRLEDFHKKFVDNQEEMGNKNQIFLTPGTDKGVEYKNSHLLNIPSDMLGMIMELCLGVEYMNFRATCKRCLLAAPLIKWSNETSLRRLQTHAPVSPWLMVVDRKRDIITFTDPVTGDNYFLKNSKLLIEENQRICYSRFGWLLFKKSDLNRFVLFNPFTDDLRELPETKYVLQNLCFSAPPTSVDCMVVGFTATHVCFHFVNQKGTWRALRLGTDPHTVSFSAFYGRDLFVVCDDGKVIVLNNLGQKECSGDVYDDKAFKGYCRSSAQYYVMDRDQHRLLVTVGEYGEAVEVFQSNKSKKIWEKLDSVGKHTIYISDTACFCIEAKAPIMENKIFFSRLHTKNKRVVFYSLETCRYHTIDAQNFQEHLENFFGTVHHLSHNVWIEPSWS